MRSKNGENASRDHLAIELGKFGVFNQNLTDKLSEEAIRNIILAISTSGSNSTIANIPTETSHDHNAEDQNNNEVIDERDHKEISLSSSQVLASPKLTNADKQMLKLMLNAKEKLSVLSIAKELDIPMTTVQRRRKKLESEILDCRYTLQHEKFGLRKMTLLISINKGTPMAVGRLLLNQEGIISVTRIIGANNANLKADVLFRDNAQLVNIIDNIKSLPNVEHVTWTETIEVFAARPDAALTLL